MGAATTAEHEKSDDDMMSLTRGGPWFGLQRKFHLEPRSGKAMGLRFAWVIIFVTWLPLVLLGTPSSLHVGRWDPLLLRSEVHVRLLGALPLILLAEGLLEQRVAAVTRALFDPEVLPAAQHPSLRESFLRLARTRDARLPEILLLCFVYAGSLAAFSGALPVWWLRWIAPAIHEAGPQWSEATPVWWWYLLISQPVFLFVFARWLFRWTLWGRLMWHAARLAPRIDPSHADRAGGLGFLAGPLFALRFFVAGFGLAIASVWLDEIAMKRVDPKVFSNDVVLFLGLTAMIAMLPYTPFTRLLVEAKHKGVQAYSLLMRRYVSRFDRRWLHLSASADDSMLGCNDFSSLADLGTGFSVVKEMRSSVPGLDDLKALLVAGVAPFLVIPLLYGKSTAELVQRLLLRLIGG